MNGPSHAFLLLGIVEIYVSRQGSYLAIALSTASNLVLLQAAITSGRGWRNRGWRAAARTPPRGFELNRAC